MKSDATKDYKEWIKKAEEDLAFAKDIFKEGKYLAHVCMACQQAVEKYLKAYIVKTRGEIRKKDKTHKLLYLAELCGEEGLNLLEDYENDLRVLTGVYAPAKYPVPTPKEFDKEETKRLLEITEEIIEEIKEKL